MELLQWDTGRVDALEFQKAPTQIDSLFNHEIQHFFRSQICKRCVTIWKQIRIVMLDQTISNLKPLGFQRGLLDTTKKKNVIYTQTQTLVTPRTRSDPEVLRRCQGHGQLRSRRLVATRAEHDRSIHAERQALWLVRGWCFRSVSKLALLAL